MSNPTSDNKKGKSSLLGILLSPGAKIIGAVFSLFAAILFGGFQLSRRKKKKATEAEARLAFSNLITQLHESKNYLSESHEWLKKQQAEAIDIKEVQMRYAGLKNLYNNWVAHERMEEILGTVQYDPRIGMNVSNGLHELRSLNIIMEALIRDEKLGTEEGANQLNTVCKHLADAIDFFSYIDKYEPQEAE